MSIFYNLLSNSDFLTTYHSGSDQHARAVQRVGHCATKQNERDPIIKTRFAPNSSLPAEAGTG